MCFGCFRPCGNHFSAFPAETENRKKFEILTILGHFGPILGPFWTPKGPREAKNAGGTGQNGPKGGQQAIQMCFETVLDHLDTILSETENRFFFEILTILGHFGPFVAPFWPILGPFWAPKWPRKPQNAGGNRPKGAKRGSTSHKNVFWGYFRPCGSKSQKKFDFQFGLEMH